MVWLGDVGKLVEVLAVLIEDLNAIVGPIGDIHAAVSVDGNRMWRVELAVSGAGCPPGQQELSVLVELYDTRIAISVAYKKRAIRQPGDVGGPLEMFVVVAGLIPHSKGHQQLLAIIGEFENLMMNVVNHPDVVLGIVRADQDGVRSTAILEEMIPLRPCFDQLAAGIHDSDTVLKHGRHTCGLLTERTPEAIETARQFIRQLQFAAVADKDFVGRFSENSTGRSPNISLIG